VGRDRSVVIATCYGLDGPGIESRRVAITVHFQTGPGAHSAYYTTNTKPFPGAKRPGHGDDHLPHLAPRLKKEYTNTFIPLWAFADFSRVDFTFTFTRYVLGTLPIRTFSDKKPIH